MAIRAFDLNIEEVLEDWQVEHALREIIANALDEQLLSSTKEIEILSESDGTWHIRDFGRGLRIEHFTLSENKEKLTAASGVIGKFGVGLKDALATFHRRGVEVLVRSRFGTYRLRKEQKVGFSSILTLHVEYDDSPNDMHGTDFVLHGVPASSMDKAKSQFLRFAGEETLDTNAYGQILRRSEGPARVYILGVLANEEPNFLFSYNIASLTAAMKSKLNRERNNVGRATYADRVKALLRNAGSEAVVTALVDQVQQRAVGTQRDEMGWIEISQMALTLLNQRQRVAYVTETELQARPDVLSNVRADGYHVVVITEQQKAKLEAQERNGGASTRTLTAYVQEYNESFQYKFVAAAELAPAERLTYSRTSEILALVGLSVKSVPPVLVSETMRITSDFTEGVWDPAIKAIVIKRSRLSSLVDYAGTLLHEVGHATSGALDATRDFEAILTNYLGQTAAATLAR